jgi:hypothetical protein
MESYVQEVLQQSPPHVTYEDAERILNSVDGDVVKALQLIWKIQDKPKPPKTEWEERRENANAVSEAIAKYKKLQNKTI